jgi:reactive intermediate/imine deaminase
MSESLQAVATPSAPAALGAYSQGVTANGLVFVSGQLGLDPQTGELVGDTAAQQAAQALQNITHILEAAGTSTDRVVRATVYLNDVNDFSDVDTQYAKVFNGSVKPARVAFGGNALPKGALVEIDAIALV